ncbi:uncharacterized protein LOC115444372 [Manduca sexta]|uniref:uncharacterized protein LOC115444372 n=1 Tax=Manduca sexta TaxID=7130 RepID=UPI00188E096C|nr:uncharacterized protein LOC115444372 [Manduca sexta]
MDEKQFVWTPELTRRLFELRFDNDWLFKKKKQPWSEFREILIQNGFPEEMSVKHVRKKWSYTYDMYKIAKKMKNKDWKFYKLFDKHYAKSKILDKYESWSDEWRLKLITCITETKGLNLDFLTMWRTVERAMRCQDLPSDCCVQDMKGLWQHIRTTFNRKHRLKMKKGAELTEWPLYDVMVQYFQKYEPDHLVNLENDSAYTFFRKQRDATKYCKRKRGIDDNDNENEFQWSKDITESFIQVRLQNDWLFRERKWAWNDLLKIMLEEHGFPKTLTSREIGRKWAATFGEYQKAKATNNKSWVYYTIFELYLGEGSLSLNPLVGWQEEWVFNLISARTDLEHMFDNYLRDPSSAWREVEKRLRVVGLPLDHSLLDLPEIWTHLVRTFKWKRKFAKKGMLTEHWPYFEAMARYIEMQDKKPVKKQKREIIHSDDGDGNDDYEDDMKLFDIKRQMEAQVKPKCEYEDANQCRACYSEDGCVDIFSEKDEDDIDVAYKLRVVGGIQVDKSDHLPSQICLNCLQELDNAFKFRRRCQDSDKQFRNNAHNIKIEIDRVDENEQGNNYINRNRRDDNDANSTKGFDNDDMDIFDSEPITNTKHEKAVVKAEKRMKRKKRRMRKLNYDYSKICEICGKHTRNLVSHLDAHTTGKTYSCDVCEKRFKFKSGLIIHKAVHDPTPKKTCEVCGKTFHVLAQYRRHFVYHANERKFECETCGKRFNTSDILKVHNRTHTDERPFSCQECGKSFRTAGCVSRHKRIVHRHVRQKPK